MIENDALSTLQRRQAGVISRRQVTGHGGTDALIARMLRRREWAPMHRGIFVDHTGEPTWEQRAWAGVLAHPRAALDASSALRAHGLRTTGRSDAGVIDIVVPAGARVRDPAGVRSRQLTGFEEHCQLHLSPPRVRLELAALRAAASASTEDAVIALLGDTVQTGRTTPARLRAALDGWPYLPGRTLLDEVLGDLSAGALSALEQRYLRDVERAHGLPHGLRQVRTVTGAGISYCDVRYDEEATTVELDGALGHSSTADRWDDLERDAAALVGGQVTLRAGWRQVLDPCRLARTVGAVLEARGCRDAWHPCRRCATARAAA